MAYARIPPLLPRILCAICVSVAIAGCGPSSPGSGGEAGGETSTDDPASSSDPSSTGSDPSSPTSSSESTGDTTTGGTTEGSSEGSTTAVDGCTPPPTAEFDFLFDGEELWDQTHLEFDRACTVASVETMEEAVELAFDCTDEQQEPVAHTVTLKVDPVPELLLEVGASVRLVVFFDAPWWANAYGKITDPAGELLVGFGKGEVTLGEWTDGQPEYFPPSTFYDPFAMQVQLPCPAYCEEQGGNFIENPCPCYFKRAIHFALGDESELVHHRTHGHIEGSPGFDLWVGSSTSIDWDTCEHPPTDTPGGYTRFLMVRE